MAERARTIADVAAEAGVSTATVSRALNGGAISERARSAVQAAAQRLNYRRNDLARGLATGRTGVVGLLIPDVIGPLYGQMARGIEDVLEPVGMHSMMTTDNRDRDQEAEAIGLLLARRVDALILVGSNLEADRLDTLLDGDAPVVMIGSERERGDGYGTIEIDNEGGIAAAVDHLVEHGHERIGHVGGQRRDAAVRQAAFLEAVARHALTAGPVIDSDSTEEGGARAAAAVARAHRRDGVTAVICSNDRTAAGLYPALRREGLALPRDLSIVGFDDLPWCPYLDPPLTTVRQPAREMGRAAARQILTILRDGGSPERVRVAARLVPRASVRDLRPGREVAAP